MEQAWCQAPNARCSNPSTPQSRRGWAWGWRFPALSLSRTAERSGWNALRKVAPHFTSAFPACSLRWRDSMDDATIFIVDDDTAVLKALRRLLTSHGFHVHTYNSAKLFLEDHDP